MRIVIALGGNALLRRGDRPDATVQQSNIDRVTTPVAALALEHEIVITHGNEPQIGLLAMESAADPVLTQPVSAGPSGCPDPRADRLTAGPGPARHAARPQGRRTRHPHVGTGRRPGLRTTRTARRPGVPLGRRPHPGAKARTAHRQGRTRWRQVVTSPTPEGIVETETIHDLLTCGALVICAGGGGVPVTADSDTGALHGVDAVVDKDLTAALLAEELKADFLLILTDVPCVYTGYGTHDPQPLLDATPDDLRRAAFPADSMGPRTEAAARFVERTGGLAAIGALDAAYEIVHGRSGTLVRPDLVVG